MKKKKELTRYDPEKTKKMVLQHTRLTGDKDELLELLGQKLLPILADGTPEEKATAMKEIQDKAMELMRIFEGVTHLGLMETFTEKYRMFAREMAKTMIVELNCSNEAERALAELAVNAYVRVIDNSRRLNNEYESREITPNRNVYIANLSKQIDRANRQYLSAIMTLRQLKSPTVEMTIKANTAFVSHNQQVNVQKDESITP
ncbi:MAG: hypothetical protein ABIO57_03730 [Candidatus Paceibacterota bacterium]